MVAALDLDMTLSFLDLVTSSYLALWPHK